MEELFGISRFSERALSVTSILNLILGGALMFLFSIQEVERFVCVSVYEVNDIYFYQGANFDLYFLLIKIFIALGVIGLSIAMHKLDGIKIHVKYK